MSKAIAAAAINPLTILSVLSVQFSRRVAMALEFGMRAHSISLGGRMECHVV